MKYLLEKTVGDYNPQANTRGQTTEATRPKKNPQWVEEQRKEGRRRRWKESLDKYNGMF